MSADRLRKGKHSYAESRSRETEVVSAPHRLERRIGRYEAKVQERLGAWTTAGIRDRLWQKDPTIWFDARQDEITNRLGWLDAARNTRERLKALAAFGEQLREEGIRRVTLLGMGGSSLAPEVFAKTLGHRRGYPEVTVLDSTHPAAVHAATAALDPRQSLFIVSSKSGTTLETRSLFRYFWARANEVLGDRAGSHFVAVTDPDSPLESIARERRFRTFFRAQADLGGRYSALSDFGIVPAAAMGADIATLLDRAVTASDHFRSCKHAAEDAGTILGAVLGELALAGRDKVTFAATPSLDPLPDWIEQLIAESTGKSGKGILPVAHEPPRLAEAYGDDRLFVAFVLAGESSTRFEDRLESLTAAGHPVIRIELPDLAEIGAEMFRWEVAVALAGAALGIHPFNQPDVQLAKDLTKQAMESASTEADSTDAALDATDGATIAEPLRRWLGRARPHGYLALQAYLAPTKETTAALQEIRSVLGERTPLATTFGYGPRFLHSTGQLHKGGPDTGLFLQIVDAAKAHDLPVPETDYTFGRLIEGQAQGDAAALRERGRTVLRLNVGRDAVRGLAAIAEALRNDA